MTIQPVKSSHKIRKTFDLEGQMDFEKKFVDRKLKVYKLEIEVYTNLSMILIYLQVG
jgi:hypothetical protein